MVVLVETVEEIEEKLSDLLTKCDLNHFVDVKKIKKWIANMERDSASKKEYYTYITMLSGLLDDDKLRDRELVTALFNTVLELYRHTPIHILDDKKPFERLEEIYRKNRFGDLQLDTVEFCPKDWVSLYDDAMDCMYRKDITTAAVKFDEVFTSLLNDKTAYREIYRIFCNAGLAHLFSGNPTLGLKCITIAKELNPNYKFADTQLEMVQNELTDPLIQLGYLRTMRNNIAKWHEEVGSEKEFLNRDKVRNWSDSEILKKLFEMGVKVDKPQFIECARTVQCSDDLAAKLFAPQYKPSGNTSNRDEDFLWIAAAVLWDIYCPEEPETTNLNKLLETATEFIWSNSDFKDYSKEEMVTVYNQYLRQIEKYIYSEKSGFLKHWTMTFEYQNDARYNLMDFLKECVLYLELEKRVLDLTELLQTQIPDGHWELIKINLLVQKGEIGWEEIYRTLQKKDPFYCYYAYYIAKMLEKTGNIEKTEQFLLEAVQIIDARKYNEVWDLEIIPSTIYEDYKFILTECQKFYQRYNFEKSKLKRIELKLKLIEENSKSYSYSSRLEKMQRALKEVEEIESNKNPAIQYYNFLKQYEINFATNDEVNTHVNYIKIGPEDFLKDSGSECQSTQKIKSKVGRNTPCPCGSGKKYKKCCLKLRK
ncbi:MAG TPA: SEC-C metal-binding domain-containing protein [Candidatus Deferrimicrobium sp.]|nr:SEC-C metal-binding domain-containing protein [Candidatus Deferrimicrobium sp.]